ncbi:MULTISPECIES: MarR family winged helix-turn-helix transcriptional regulator [Lysinibacillus]|uniref:MarR family transcriptional regulator n=1 Tax=Lysinibacillus antri TaxID=2498145 RepID=A0A3S0RUU4_9BACI|nr:MULTISPECIES: MarR family winged helix-turn-helix transcriptional regulator [Lysinibacillus]RUL50923.1 MarR family transcriptional regulator [Lysinibacillus antri]TSI05750.1 winged helix-turn-helix transcriptional regulator [Lysinibacillus sp. BW-2-10]
MENKREIFHVLTRRFGLLDKNCCSIGSFEISPIQSHILYEIDQQHEPSMQQIAQNLAMDITTFSRQIQTLVKMDLVKKTPSSVDKRVSILSLTVQGKFVATTIDHSMNAYLDEVFSHMNEFERETVLRSLKLLNEAMSKSSVCCTPLY